MTLAVRLATTTAAARGSPQLHSALLRFRGNGKTVLLEDFFKASFGSGYRDMPPIACSNENKLQKIGILFVACRYFLRIDECRDTDDILNVVCKSFA